MKKIFICSLLFLTTILWSEEGVFTAYKKPEEKKTPIAIGIQGSYLFHMYNNDIYSNFEESFNVREFNHGGVGLNLTIGSAQEFHTVIYAGISFYQNVNTINESMAALNPKNDHIGGKFTIDFIPVNVKLSKKSLSTFYTGVGIGFDTIFDPNVYVDEGAFYGLLSFRIPIGFAIRSTKEVEFYIQNAFQLGLEMTGMTGSFAITSDLEFGVKFWLKEDIKKTRPSSKVRQL